LSFTSTCFSTPRSFKDSIIFFLISSLDKLLGKKEGSKFWSKIGEELASTGRNVNAGKISGGMSLGRSGTGPSTDTLMGALGKAPNVNPSAGLNKGVKQDRINQILRTRKQR